MALDVISMVLANTFTEESLIGGGAIKGKNCTISTISESDDGNEVKFLWNLDDGTQKTSTLKIKNGISVTSVDIDEATNNMTCTFSDGTIQECGTVNVVTDVDKIEYTTNVDATIKTVGDALDKLVTKTDSELEEALTANVSIGQISSGKTYPKGTSLEDIIRDMLTEKIPPAVTITLNPSTLLYDEVTGSIASLTINATVTKKTYNVEKVEFYINDTLVHTTTSSVTNGGSFPYVYNTVINDDTVIKVVATDVENLKTTQTKTITFIGQSYYGIVDATIGEPTEALVKTLNKTLKNTNKFLYEGITCDYNKIIYAYPSELGKLTSIMDKVNNFNYTSSFQLTTKTIDGIEYYIYTLIDPTGADGVTLTFE